MQEALLSKPHPRLEMPGPRSRWRPIAVLFVGSMLGLLSLAASAQTFGTPTYAGWSFDTPLLPYETRMFDSSTDTYRNAAFVTAAWFISSKPSNGGAVETTAADGFTRYDTLPMGWSGDSAHCPVACELFGGAASTSVAFDAGALHAQAQAGAAGNNDVRIENASSAVAAAVVGDTITLDQDATITFHGQLSGQLASQFPGAGSGDMTFAVGVIDPGIVSQDPEHFGPIRQAQSYTISRSVSAGASVYGAQDFSFDLDLSEGDNYVMAVLLVSASSGANWVTGGGGSALFGDTATFSMTVPDGVQLGSAAGLFAIDAVPEPPASALVAGGLAMVVWLARRLRG